MNAIRHYLLWFITTATCFVLILSSQTTQGILLRDRLTDIFVATAHPITSTLRVTKVWRENRELRLQLARLSLQVAENSQSQAELPRLRNMLEFKDRSSVSLKSAEVIGNSPSTGLSGIIVNIGADDNVKFNQPVITSEGVVGRVYRVGATSTIVQLLTDPNLGVAGKLMSSGENGILHSAGRGLLQFHGLPISVKISIGDTVVTSGLGGAYPRGLYLGVVKDYFPSSNEWLWDIDIIPSVNFINIEEVFIVQITK